MIAPRFTPGRQIGLPLHNVAKTNTSSTTSW